jgi:hypothetical protein
MHLQRGFACGDGRADLKHVRAQNLLSGWMKMVGVILHERCAAGQADAHHFHGTQQGGSFPVAFRAKTITFRHKML